jgi:hypothetical protein
MEHLLLGESAGGDSLHAGLGRHGPSPDVPVHYDVPRDVPFPDVSLPESSVDNP